MQSNRDVENMIGDKQETTRSIKLDPQNCTSCLPLVYGLSGIIIIIIGLFYFGSNTQDGNLYFERGINLLSKLYKTKLTCANYSSHH